MKGLGCQPEEGAKELSPAELQGGCPEEGTGMWVSRQEKQQVQKTHPCGGQLMAPSGDGLGSTEDQRVKKKQRQAGARPHDTFNGVVVGGGGSEKNHICISERSLQLPFREFRKDLQDSMWRDQLRGYCNSPRETRLG